MDHLPITESLRTFPDGSDQISETMVCERPQLKVPNGFSHPMEFAVMKIMTEFPDLELKLLRVTATNDIVMTVECGDTFNGFTKEQWIGLRNEFRRYFGLIRFLDTRCRNVLKYCNWNEGYPIFGRAVYSLDSVRSRPSF